MWHQWHKEMPGRCNHFQVQGWVSAGVSSKTGTYLQIAQLTVAVLLDVVILAIPLKPLYHLELSWRKRLSIMLMFAVGWFACIIAIIRLKYLVQFRHTENPTCRYGNRSSSWH